MNNAPAMSGAMAVDARRTSLWPAMMQVVDHQGVAVPEGGWTC
jgi:hypothetical protein